MSRVEAYLDTLVGKEGGYANHPSDRGGPTMWGVTEAVARAYGYRGPMAAMPRAVALEVYRARYWRAPGFDAIEAVDAPVAERLLDIGVNMGPSVAGRMLQRLLNALNGRGSLYADLTVDGQCGAMTRAAMSALIAKRGTRAREVLLQGLRALQATRYVEIAEGDPKQEDFTWGWLSGRAFG